MQHKKAKLCAALTLCLGMTIVHAQESVPVSGGNATSSGGFVSYSVGQVVYTTNTGAGSIVIQGVQQPYEISVTTGNEDAKDITLEFVVYPNPAKDVIKLKILNYELDNLRYSLYNINGNLIFNDRIQTEETSISLKTLLPATYFLRLTDNIKIIKIFKIIKN